MIAWSGAAHAAEVGIVIAASTLWTEECEDAELCPVPNRALRFADDDAWRVSWAWSEALGPDDVYVFTETGDELPWVRPPLPGGATLDAIHDALVGRTDIDGVWVYVAAHGTSRGVHLDDRIVRFEDLLDRLREWTGGAPIELVATDVCSSQQWKMGPGGPPEARPPAADEHRWPDTRRSHTEGVEFVIKDGAPEELQLGGGSFTRLWLSAILGAADDGDTIVEAQEAMDYVQRYAGEVPGSFVSDVRAPGSRPDYPVPSAFGRAALTVHGREIRSRWLVEILAGGREYAFIEAYTDLDESATVHLPPGQYRLTRVLFADAIDHYGFLTTTCVVSLSPGDFDADLCEWSPALRVLRGPDDDDSGEPTPDAVRDVLYAWPSAIPRPLPRRADRWYGGDRTWLLAGVRVDSPILGRSGGMVGGDLAWIRPTHAGRGHLVLRVGAAHEVGGLDVSRASEVFASVGTDQALLATRRLRLGALLDGGGALYVLDNGVDMVATVTPLMDAGFSATVPLGGWSVRSEVTWRPRQPFLLGNNDSGLAGEPEVTRGGLFLGVQRTW